MVSSGVSWRGKSDILPGNAQLRFHGRTCMELLRNNLLPACEKLSPGGFILQDGARSHRSKATHYLSVPGKQVRLHQQGRMAAQFAGSGNFGKSQTG